MIKKNEICTNIYNELGDNWYTATDDPIALLRAEASFRNNFILQHLEKKMNILDLGCGAGFTANFLAQNGFQSVTGLDSSSEALNVARRWDQSQKVTYILGDALKTEQDSNSFDVVMAWDFIEHIQSKEELIQEIHRILKPGGLFFFHTFAKNLLSDLIIIRFLEMWLPKTPKNLHVIDLFIDSSDLNKLLNKYHFIKMDLFGIRPEINFALFYSLFYRRIHKKFSFKKTNFLGLGYVGYFQKKASQLS